MPASEDKKNVSEDEKYSFIEEHIIPKRRDKTKRILIAVAATVVLALVFGGVSSLVFCLSNDRLQEILDKDKEEKIRFTTPVPTPTTTPIKDKKKEDIKIIENKVDATIKDFSKIYSQISSIATEFNKSVVTVSSVVSGVDMFENPTERKDSSYGVVIAKNKRKILILHSKDKMEKGNTLKVTFFDNYTVDASLYGYDKETGIAILAVSVSDVPEGTLKSVSVAKLGETYYLTTGLPVLALGSPNGYVYSMGMGIVTNKSADKYITDYKLELFNTDLTSHPKGEGVITNLEGIVLGVITHKFDDEFNQYSSTLIGITKLKPIIEQLVNREERIYFGVVANDVVSGYLKRIGAKNGIYIVEVHNDSPALRANLKPGDVITEVNGQSVISVSGFYDIISAGKKGDGVLIKILREKGKKWKEYKYKLQLDKRD